MLLWQLPQTGRFFVSFTDGASAWSTTDHLLALVVDVLQGANWQRASGGKKKHPRPKPLDRPRDMAARREHERRRREAWDRVQEKARERAQRKG